jgi:benzodiazapine receptor
MKLNQITRLVFAVLICQMAGVVGSLFTFPAIPKWYARLYKPSFSPPNWLFAPAWITLFTLMGISVYLVWNQGLGKKEVKNALVIFGVQLVLNVLWSFFFFKLQAPFYALIEILFLWLAILLTLVSFLEVSKTAALLLLPYLVWVSFAAVLNFSLFQLNR